jgi:hypothetical protein
MKFTTVVAAVLSMAAFGIAAPTPVVEGTSSLPYLHGMSIILTIADVQARQNHGMCVKSTAGNIEQIVGCS